MGGMMAPWPKNIGAAVTLLLAGCMHGEMPSSVQPIIDMHRHTPWPGDSDSEGIALIHEAMRAHDVVATALFITDREDVALYRSGDGVRFLLSPMFPCPRLTAERKWCFAESGNNLPDPEWLDQALAAGELAGIGELVFNYAGMEIGRAHV